jgi:aryl-alcohol dehydrogenase-like predicted oxidoreductase
VEYEKLYTSVGLGTTIWSPLASGTLTDKYIGKFPKSTRLSLENLQWLKERSLTTERLDKIDKLNQLARESGTSLAKFAIAWCLQNPHVSTAILGASKPHQLEETLQALDLVAMFNNEIKEKVETILDNKPK